MKRTYPESELHKSVKKYLDLILTPDSWWTSIGHGNRGKSVRGALWKAQGAKKGVPDILIQFAGRAHWIELKSPVGTLSPEQNDCHQAIVKAGGCVTVARSIDHVSDALARWQIPTRERRGSQLPVRVLPSDEVEAA